MTINAFISACPDVNTASLSRRLGVPDSTVRSWPEQARSPKFDDVVRMAPRMPDALRFSLLQALAGDRFCITPGDCGDTAPAASPADVHTQSSALQGKLLMYASDGEIDQHEHRDLERTAHELTRTVRTLRPGRIGTRAAGAR